MARFVLCLFVLLGSSCRHIRIPYFGNTLTQTEVCGDATSDCQPQQVTIYTTRNSADFVWQDKASDVIGHSFNDKHILQLFDSCYDPEEGKHFKKDRFSFKASLDDTRRKEFKTKIGVEFDRLLQSSVKDQDAKAHIRAGFESVVDEGLKTSADIAYTLYSPTSTLYSAPGFQRCLSVLPANSYVITGVGVIEVSNQSFETNINNKLSAGGSAAFKLEYQKMAFGVDATAELERITKLAITNGLSSNWSYVYSIGYTDNSWGGAMGQRCRDGKSVSESIASCAEDYDIVASCCGKKLTCKEGESAKNHQCVPLPKPPDANCGELKNQKFTGHVRFMYENRALGLGADNLTLRLVDGVGTTWRLAHGKYTPPHQGYWIYSDETKPKPRALAPSQCGNPSEGKIGLFWNDHQDANGPPEDCEMIYIEADSDCSVKLRFHYGGVDSYLRIVDSVAKVSTSPTVLKVIFPQP